MFTDEQREMFSKILDLNMEYENETNVVKKYTKMGELVQAKAQLKESMGEEAYNTFMRRGKQMFAPKM